MALSNLECKLVSVDSDKVLDLIDDKAMIWSSSSASVNQQWRIVPVRGDKADQGQFIEEREYAIESLTTGRAVSAKQGSVDLTLSDYSGAADQRWRFVPTEGMQGQYRVENVKNGMVFGCYDAQREDGTQVIQHRYEGGAHQRWQITPLHPAWTWGLNNEGQLGSGTRSSRNEPAGMPLRMGARIKAISAGTYHTLALLEDGTVWAWGSQDFYQLGNPTYVDQLEPGQVVQLDGVTAISAGGWHNLALLRDGTVRAWGLDGQGQLGDGAASGSRYEPTQVVDLKEVIAISAGGRHSLALLGDGNVRAWGTQDWYQLGNPTWANRPKPGDVVQLAGVKVDQGDEGLHGRTIAAGPWHSLALLADGTVRAWGANNHGQLGGGASWGNQYKPPVRALGLEGVEAVAVGSHHSLALREDGTVWAWGYNGYGQLGDGTNQSRDRPVQVVGLEGVKTIAAGRSDGSHHNLALREDGTLWAWGYNGYGQLGDGTNQSHDRPVQVVGVQGVKTIAAGGYHSVATGWPVTVAELVGAQALKTGYDEKTVEDLRHELRERDLKVSGAKQELVARLEEDDTEATARLTEAQAEKAGYRERTVEDLRHELRERDLKVSGSKQELVARLEEDDTEANARLAEAEAVKGGDCDMTVEDFREELPDYDSKVSGDEHEVVARLQDDDDARSPDDRRQLPPRTGGHMPTARQRVTDSLVRIIARHRYPSHQLLDRLERSLRTRQDLEAYSWILSKVTENQRYPSLRLLDRLDSCALAHELTAPSIAEDDDRAGP